MLSELVEVQRSASVSSSGVVALISLMFASIARAFTISMWGLKCNVSPLVLQTFRNK